MQELSPALLIKAYCAGLFPMAPSRDSKTIHWYDPDPRGVLPIAGLHVPRRLIRRIKQAPYRITTNQAFSDVMRGCADTRDETWINDDIIAIYTDLHRQGFAHSVEAWDNGTLVGGIYGIALGSAFFGESMFSTARDASKITLVHLVARLYARGFTLFDTQFINPHLLQFGAHEIPRDTYHQQLADALMRDVRFDDDDQSCAGASAGASSDVNSCARDVALFLQSITHTS